MATAGAIRAGRAYVELFADDSKLVKGLRTAEYKVRAFGKELSGIGQGFMKLGAVIAAPLALGVREFSTYGDRIAKMSKATGIGAQSLSELAFAAERSGTDLESLQTGLRRMSKSVYELQGGGKEAAETFAALGLSVSDLQGLKPEEQFKRIADGLSRVEDETARAALAQKIFGRGSGALIPLLAQGAAGIEALQQKARDLGIVMSDQDARAAELLHDALTDVQFSVKAAARAIGAALAPSVRDVATAIPKVVKGFIDWTKAHQGLIIGLGKVAAVLIGTSGLLMLLGNFTGILADLIRILPMLAKLIHGVNVAAAFLAANPIVAVLAAVAIAAGIVAFKMRDAGEYTAQLTHEAQALREETERQVQADSDRWHRLQQLSEAAELNKQQMAEARSLIGQLESQYGALGVTIDETTGKINGMAEGQKALNKLMREGVIIAGEKELIELRSDYANLQKELESARRLILGPEKFWAGREKQVKAQERYHELTGTYPKELGVIGAPAGVQAGSELDLALRELAIKEAIQAERIASPAGIMAPSALPGEAAGEVEKDWIQKLRELRIEAISDEYQRAIASINERYRIAKEKAGELGAKQATLDAIEAARLLELDNLKADRDRKMAEDQTSFVDDLNKQIADLKIDLMPDEAERELARKLEAEARRFEGEFGRAIELGLSTAPIEKLHEGLRDLILAGTQQAISLATTAAGTFNPLAAWGMAIGPGTSAAERTAKATEETAKGVKRIVQLQFD